MVLEVLERRSTNRDDRYVRVLQRHRRALGSAQLEDRQPARTRDVGRSQAHQFAHLALVMEEIGESHAGEHRVTFKIQPVLVTGQMI